MTIIPKKVPPTLYLSRMPKELIQKQKINLGNKNEWDICYKYNPPYNILCNFSASSFMVDGVKINSMEGFLQSLKIQDVKTQKKACQLPGFLAKKVGNYLKRSKQYNGEQLYWNGIPISRSSDEYQQLLNKAYGAKFAYDKEFRQTLSMSKGYKLTHKIGKSSPEETVLTEKEFIDHLDALREPSNITGVFKRFCLNVKNYKNFTQTAPNLAKNLPDLKTTFINSNTICGEKIFNHPKISLKSLKNEGVSNIIEIGTSPELQEINKELCAKHGLGYFCLDISKQNYNKLVNEDLVKLINMRNDKGISYISCDNRTDSNSILALNYLFNPNADMADSLLFGTPKHKKVRYMVKMVKKFITPETKKKLGWDKTFEEQIEQRKQILLDINL